MPLASKPITPLHQSLLRLLHSYSQPSACPPLLKPIPLRANSVLFRRDVHRHLLGARYFSARTVRGIASGGGLRTDRFKVQTRGHMGHHHHGHDHGHGGHEHDTTLLTSKDTSNPGVRITRIGLYIFPLHSPRRLKLTSRLVNLALVFIKAAAGVLLHSSSLLADAGHSAADILSDILTLSTITFSSREPTLTYPLGFGKVETLGAIGVSSLLRISPAPAHKASLIPLWRHR